jgi:diguanylate cyclase (GGDEF)-like protein/PAS domain S-box-containing protein
LLLGVSFLLTVGVIVALGWQATTSYQASKRFEDQYLRAEHSADDIVYYEELLTQSARLAAATGDEQWSQRYADHAGSLDAAIADVRELGVDGFFDLSGLQQVDASHQRLSDIEQVALAHVAAGRASEAQDLLFGEVYASEKQNYAAGLARLSDDLHHSIEEGVVSEQASTRFSLGLSIGALIVSVVVWSVLWRRLYKWHQRITRLELQRQFLADAAAEARVQVLTQSSSDVAAVVDSGTAVHYVSSSIGGVLGYQASPLLGTKLESLVHADDRCLLADVMALAVETDDAAATTEVRMANASGDWRVMEIAVRDRRDNRHVGGLVINMRDVTERVEAQRGAQLALTAEQQQSVQFRHQADHDALTGLLNRAAFQRAVNHQMVAHGGGACVVVVDLDGFKEINDTRGHLTGDRVLGVLSERLRSAVRDSDVVGRLGGDEFGVLVHTPNTHIAHRLAERMLLAISAPIVEDSGVVALTASIGVAGPDFDHERLNAEAAIADADMAMYEAKRAGGNQYAQFEGHFRETFVARVALKSELDIAITEDQFELYFQPVWDLRSGQPLGAEALVRWHHPTRGLLPPAEFLPLAESTGQICGIDKLVVNRVCRQLREWASLDDPRFHNLALGLNLSAVDFSSTEVADHVIAQISSAGVKPSAVMVEVTESAVMGNLEAARRELKKLDDFGCRLALDDFGTGYSSLAQLQRLRFDVLKIDRSFIASGNTTNESLTGAIVGIAQLLDMLVVAEGIETEEQLHWVSNLGCHFGQGYLLAQPMPAAEFNELIEQLEVETPVARTSA